MNRYRKIILLNMVLIGAYAIFAGDAFNDQREYKKLIAAQAQAELIEEMNPRARTAALIAAPILTLSPNRPMNSLTFKYSHTEDETVYGELWKDDKKLGLASIAFGEFFGFMDGISLILGTEDLREEVKRLLGKEFVVKLQ